VSKFFQIENFSYVLSMKVTFYKHYSLKNHMFLNTGMIFYDELSVFLVHLSSLFRLILHLLDPDPGSQSNADPEPDPKH
jgi:hypothetical protein